MVATALSIPPSEDPHVLTVAGDLTDSRTADQVVTQALARFGRGHRQLGSERPYPQSESLTHYD